MPDRPRVTACWITSATSTRADRRLRRGRAGEVLARLDTKQQALILGHAVPMPVVIKPRAPMTKSFTRRFRGNQRHAGRAHSHANGDGKKERRMR